MREGIRLLEDKEQAEAMKRAQKACIKGDSGKRIADFLEDQGYSCPEVYKYNTAEYKNTMV